MSKVTGLLRQKLSEVFPGGSYWTDPRLAPNPSVGIPGGHEGGAKAPEWLAKKTDPEALNPSSPEYNKLMKSLVPAIRVGGRVFSGDKGQIHAHILDQIPSHLADKIEDDSLGFVDTNNGTFFLRKQLGGLQSQDLGKVVEWVGKIENCPSQCPHQPHLIEETTDRFCLGVNARVSILFYEHASETTKIRFIVS